MGTQLVSVSRIRFTGILAPMFCMVAMFASFVIGCGPTGGFRITPVPIDQTLQEEVVDRDSGFYSDKIAIIDVSGLIVNQAQGGFFSDGEQPVSMFAEKLTVAENDKNVKAVILRINSPGGTVTASHLMHLELMRFRERCGKPVVAMMMDVAASGGYYIACATDEIVACPTTVTGSIGVIMQMFNLSGTMQKIGVKSDAIVSGPRKDSGSPFREMRFEERESFQNLVDAMYAQFLQVVCDGRPKLAPERVRELADGRVYLAPEALENGLIDRIGSIEDAVIVAKNRAGIKKAKVIIYHRPLGWRPTWYAESNQPPARATTVNLVNLSLPDLFTSGPNFLYLWNPGWSGN